MPPEAEKFMNMFMGMWETGLSLDKAGDIVFEAIKDEAFYILTDKAIFWKNMIKERMEGILDSFKQNKQYSKKQ